MIPSPQDNHGGPARLQPPSNVPENQTSCPTSSETASYRPTSVFRRLLDQSLGDWRSEGAASRSFSPQHALARRPPKFLTFLGASILVGIASGFLELAVLEIQMHVRQSVGWHSLMVSRHISWMLPVTAPLVITFLTVILVWPALPCLPGAADLGDDWHPWRWPGFGTGRERSWARSSLSDQSSHFAFSIRWPRSPWRWDSGFDSARDVSRHHWPALPLLFVRGNRDAVAGDLPNSSVECHGLRAESGRGPLRGRLTQSALDRGGHSPSGSDERVRVSTKDDTGVGVVGEARDHVRDGALGGTLDITIARDHVHRALALRARRADRQCLSRARSDAGRASSFPGLSDERHRGQRQDLQRGLRPRAWIRRLPRLPMQPGDQPDSDDE